MSDSPAFPPAAPDASFDTNLDRLRELVEQADIDGFLTLYAQLRPVLTTVRDPRPAQLVPRLFEPMALREIQQDRVGAASLVRLWQAARSFCPVLVDVELLAAIDKRIDAALASVQGPQKRPAARLLQPEPVRIERVPAPVAVYEVGGARAEEPTVLRLQRKVYLVQSYAVGEFRDSLAGTAARTLARSPQELAFVKALRMFFPQLHVQVNVPLSNFMDFGASALGLDDGIQRFLRASMVDVLLCTDELDPVAGFELDSSYHDDPGQQEADLRKNQLFDDARIPLVRIRDSDPSTATAEDFYDLLVSDERLGALRPRRIRVRREPHHMLVPSVR